MEPEPRSGALLQLSTGATRSQLLSYGLWLFHAYKIPGQQDLCVDRFYVTGIHNVGCKRCVTSVGAAQGCGGVVAAGQRSSNRHGTPGLRDPLPRQLLRRRVALVISSDAAGNDRAQRWQARPTAAARPSCVPAGTPAFQQRSRDFSSPPAPAASRASCPPAGPGAGETTLGNWLEEMSF